MGNRLPTEVLDELELLHRVGIALSAEKNKDRLIEMILIEAKSLCNADGGTLYLRSDDDLLHFEIVRTDSLSIALGGTTGTPCDFPPIPLFDDNGDPNHKNVVSHAVHAKQSVNIPDAYDAEGFDFSGTKAFDKHNGYRSTSFLTIPMINNEGLVIAVLQLINARSNNEVVPFAVGNQRIVESLASQAAIALDNQLLYDGQKELLEAFIKLIASSIDAKSPYTGAHCERVPIITEMLARVACEATEGPTKDFQLDEDQWYELRIAAWLHDCGKVTTPVHVMDKATKLETISDRIEVVRTRFELMRRDTEIAYLRNVADGGDKDALKSELEAALAKLDEEQALLEKSNVGGEFLPPETQAQIREIGKRRVVEAGVERDLLDEHDIENLCISRGTLTNEERIIINGHMVQTIKMLDALPFTRNLRRVPEYAGGHHEKMDGKGYPKGLFAGDMSIPARIMAIADVFEALTASDRPYKKAKTLSTTMRIMGEMKRHNHLDPALLDLFVTSGVYRQFAQRFLDASLIDEVDEQAILDIEPKDFELPGEEVRQQRWSDFLDEYK
jgi:HD-GYP domain-containing protein (c-di-GMP phosphodiesterase class II)